MVTYYITGTDNPKAISIYKKIGFKYDELMMKMEEGDNNEKYNNNGSRKSRKNNIK